MATRPITSLLKIIKVNDQRSGVKDGRPWSMQDAECILLDENGEEQQVGVLMLPKSLQGDQAPARGTYMGGFTLTAGMRDRRIEAQLVSLQPYDVRKPGAAPAVPAAAAKP